MEEVHQAWAEYGEEEHASLTFLMSSNKSADKQSQLDAPCVCVYCSVRHK
jgi:hypothetical protein